MTKLRPLILRVAIPLCVLSGCAGAEIIKTEVKPLSGVVRYKNGNFVREQSREIAVNKMNDYCKPKAYKILKEEFNPDVFSISINGSFYTPDKANYMFIHFTCE
jgi:hypothetical protein